MSSYIVDEQQCAGQMGYCQFSAVLPPANEPFSAIHQRREQRSWTGQEQGDLVGLMGMEQVEADVLLVQHTDPPVNKMGECGGKVIRPARPIYN